MERREREILQLVKEWLLFQKAWVRAEDEEKDSLQNSWNQIVWSRAVTTFIPKERDSHNIN